MAWSLRRPLYALCDRLPCRIIRGVANEPYLERYYVGTLFGVRAYIHRFVNSDPDRGLHDHPWAWAVSFILAGSYTEMSRRYAQNWTRQVRWVNFISGDSFHRVILRERDCWTLFVHPAEKVKPWGFLKSSGRTAAVWTWRRHESKSDDGEWWRRAECGRYTQGRRAP